MKTLFRITINNIEIGDFFGIHLYFIFFIFFLVLFISGLFFLVSRRSFSWKNTQKVASRSILGISVFFMIMQFLFLKEWARYSCDLARNEGRPDLMAQSFYRTKRIATIIERVLPSNCNTELVTDLDLSQGEGAYNLRALSYHLYPIDIGKVRSGKQRCFIFIDKENWQDYVPEGISFVKFEDQFGVAWGSQRSGE